MAIQTSPVKEVNMNVPLRILIVDNVEEDAVRTANHLKTGDYSPSFQRVESPRAMVKALRLQHWDIIISDFAMPRFTGLDALRIVKQKGIDIPFIIVSNTTGERNVVAALHAGAHDYILKSDLTPLVGAVKHQLRESEIRHQSFDAGQERRHSVARLRRLLDETVGALASANEKRDPYTAQHQKRVAILACAIGKELDLSDEHIMGIHVSSIMHDIGKIHMPAEILTKPGKLSDIEFSLIKTHSKVGYDILKSIEFPWPVAQTVLQHHERLDGSGYPLGISGSDIILEARIVAVADVVEAMSSHRPYRPAIGIGVALDEITENKGTLYDTDVVNACLKLFTEDNFSFDAENDPTKKTKKQPTKKLTVATAQ